MARTVSARDYHTQQTHYLRATIGFADYGSTVVLGVIPAFSIIIGAGVVVSTAFNAGTTNVLDIGTSADPDGFATDLALGTIGNIVWDELATSNDLYVTEDTTLVAAPAATGTAATAGVGHVYVLYLPNH